MDSSKPDIHPIGGKVARLTNLTVKFTALMSENARPMRPNGVACVGLGRSKRKHYAGKKEIESTRKDKREVSRRWP